MKTHGELRYNASGDVWLLKGEPYLMIRVKRMFPRCYSHREGHVTMSDTDEVARDLEWLLQRFPLELDDQSRLHLTERADAHRSLEVDVDLILTGQRPHLVFHDPARPARDYQLVAADLALRTHRLLLADELGLGKSMSALLVLRDPEALPALVVCPTHLPVQWQDELNKTLPWLRSHVLRQGQPYDVARHRSMRGHEPDVLICGYSKLRGWDSALAGKIRTVIFDEAQELRRRDSEKWRAASHIADKASFRVGCTATPVYNYAGEIHSIMEVIAPGALGTRDEFLREWSGRAQGMKGDHMSVKDPAALGRYLRSEGLLLRRTRKDVGRELPDVIRVPHAIDTDADMLERLTGDVIDLADLIVKRKLKPAEHFRAAGEFDWKMRRATGLAKAPFVADFVHLLCETDEQVVLFGWHRDVYEIWESKLAPLSPAFFTGTESPAQKRRSRDAFLDGEARVMVMSLRAGSGLDGLQEASHLAVFGELDWSPGMHEQCIGRLQRDGQEEPVVAYFLVSDSGSDPVMAEVLNVKRMQSEPILEPDTKMFTAASTTDRVRMLALDVLSRRSKTRRT